MPQHFRQGGAGLFFLRESGNEPETGFLNHRVAQFCDPSPPTANGMILSEAIAQVKWKQVLPKSNTLKPYIKPEQCSDDYRFDTALNVGSIGLSLLYFTSMFAAIARSIVYSQEQKLREQTPNVQFVHWYVDTFGRWVAPGLVLVFTSVVHQILLFKKHVKSKKKLKDVISDYDILRSDLVKKHRTIHTFFLIAEMIYLLRYSQAQGQPLYIPYEQLNEFETKLIHYCYKIGISSPVLKSYNNYTSQYYYDFNVVGDLLINFIFRNEFRPIFNEIKRHIKSNIRLIENHSILLKDHVPLNPNYCHWIDNHREMETILVGLIGQISHERHQYSSSSFLEPIIFGQEIKLSPIQSALLDYWNSKEMQKPIVNPYTVNLQELGSRVNTLMHAQYPDFIQDRNRQHRIVAV